MEKDDLEKLTEGLAEFYSYKEEKYMIPSKSMPTFYNKKMVLNRDSLNLAVMAYKEIYRPKELIFVDSMAATGISAIRLIKEVDGINKIYINDINPIAVKIIKENIELNQLKKYSTEIVISNKDANLLFIELSQISENPDMKKPNIISIDPFGTPNIYADSAFKAIKKIDGLVCFTATDTAVLFGVRPNACIRKYMSKPLHNEYCKEIGARILIYFLSRIANINKLGIIPLFTLYSGHFIRLFALTFKNKKEISKDFKNYGYIIHCRKCGYRFSNEENILEIQNKCPKCENNQKLEYAGPLWIEKIHDKIFLKKLIELNRNKNLPGFLKIEKILNYALEEIEMPTSYYNIHKLCQLLKLKYVPKMEVIIKSIQDEGFRATRTHFDFTSIKTDMDINNLKDLLKKQIN